MDTLVATAASPTLPRRGRWVVAIVVALLVACVGMLGTEAAASTPAGIVGGHHVVHDLHCEPFTAIAATAQVEVTPDAVPSDAVVRDAAACGPAVAVALGIPAAGPHGRDLLVEIGVDRN
ncbi:hypothetical protein [Pseudonocardia dioxanivorans]|uniref:Uncharacterized protein n=1 Tax=Pseudonocardia dioxanivorans (strain ATCC 55486 / DSM 44775 / JCM 13855 / CB1190) TaxID=675635 RepID=F4CXF1_PSEUX|nr:hypothetical protein [Pseudonocardia dioxanivorans]AEA26525.1 hypothetical protein Psed_4367 [Pseudonocardia dioxanivorans CB1190]